MCDIEPNAKGPTHWRERLPPSLQALDEAIWPSAYEIQGDVLMVKVEGEAATHEQAMADAMLAQLPNTRLICADEGVEGDFRVRNLRVLASRDGSTTTRTTVKEHGSIMWVDPGEVYFSARLSTQRQETHQHIKSFREQLGKPLVLADPYAGVGPSLPLLINDEGLLSGYIVGDLNPVAVDLLRMNLDAWTREKTRLFLLLSPSVKTPGLGNQRRKTAAKSTSSWSTFLTTVSNTSPISSHSSTEPIPRC